MLDKLVDVLNEILETGYLNRARVHALLMGPSGTVNPKGLPEDLIVRLDNDNMEVTMLGIINTALIRAGEPRRIIAVTGDDNRIARVEAGPYPDPVPHV